MPSSHTNELAAPPPPHDALTTIAAPSSTAPGAAAGGGEVGAGAPRVDATLMPARERWRRAIRALGLVLANPERTDQVLEFSIYANAGSLAQRSSRFFDSPVGRRLYEERRTIDARTIDLDALLALPPDTLGHAYATFLRSRGLTPDVFEAPPEEVTDPRASYVVQRLRQTHDLWHVVTGHDTDPASEIALQAFTFAQTRAPSSLLLAVLGTVRATPHKPLLIVDVARAFVRGARAERFAVFPWEDHWATPLDEVRAMLGVAS